MKKEIQKEQLEFREAIGGCFALGTATIGSVMGIILSSNLLRNINMSENMEQVSKMAEGIDFKKYIMIGVGAKCINRLISKSALVTRISSNILNGVKKVVEFIPKAVLKTNTFLLTPISDAIYIKLKDKSPDKIKDLIEFWKDAKSSLREILNSRNSLKPKVFPHSKKIFPDISIETGDTGLELR